MKIETISVSAGRTVPHPLHAYANLKAMITITARIEESESFSDSFAELQALADAAVEKHCRDAAAALRGREHEPPEPPNPAWPYANDPVPPSATVPWEPCLAVNEKGARCNHAAGHIGDHDFELPF